MAYSLTSAGSPKELLAAIVTFASSLSGWTIEYDHANGSGSSFGGQIALSSGNCHIAIGEASASENPVAVTGDGGSFNDGRLYMALGTSINASNIQFWGHPGSVVTAAADIDRVSINDVWGPMSEVHFFGDSSYITVAIRCSAQRWTLFSFGNLNTLGMSAEAAGYCLSNQHPFWATTIDSGVPWNANLQRRHGFFMQTSTNGTTSCQVMIPDGFLDTDFGFTSGDFVITEKTAGSNLLGHGSIGAPPYPEQTLSSPAASTSTNILDHSLWLRNQTTTGGMPLYALPMIYYASGLALSCFLGEIPGLRRCRLTSLGAGDETTYGSDVYMVFPWKQIGTVKDSGQDGGTYNNQPNSFDMAWAVLKDD